MPSLRAIASHVTVFLIGVILATAAGALARPPKKPSLEARLSRLESRHDSLQSNYQTLCNTLRFADKTGIQDEQARDLFVRMSDACWLPSS
jgi:hypothetical protein